LYQQTAVCYPVPPTFHHHGEKWVEGEFLVKGREDKLEPILSPKTSVSPCGRNASPYGSAQLSFSFVLARSQRTPRQISDWKLENPQLFLWHWCPIP